MGAITEPTSIVTAALFGLLSSVHCIGMCGGIAAAQTAGEDKIKSIILYCGARILSYSVVGGIVGLTGALLGVNVYLRTLIPILCGLVTILIGLKQLGLFRWLSISSKRSCPSMKLSQYGPFIVGLLTGIMPCGTLQTVQYAALSSENVFTGIGIMFAFAVASTPALAVVGIASKFLTTRGRKIITIVAALVIIYMGVKMLLKGLTLMGVIG